jgi:hypothetical protein
MILFRLWLSPLLRLLSDWSRFVSPYCHNSLHSDLVMNSSCNRRTSVSITPCVLFTYIESSEMNNELQGSPSVAARPTGITITHDRRQLARLAIDQR